MKGAPTTLYVMRHVKSRWDEVGVDDLRRGLSPRGYADAPFMGRHLCERGVHVDVVITSHATRAYETAKVAAHEIGDAAIIVDERLYLCSPETAAMVVREHGRGVESMMIVGHNPTWTKVLGLWADEEIDNLPTAAVACIEVAAPDLAQFVEHHNRLLWLVRPKDVR